MKSSPTEIRIYNSIDEILWRDWDPIGLNNDDNSPRDEYYGYIPEIFKLKMENADIETIALKLDFYSVNRMGLASNLSHCKVVARKIIDIK